MMSRESANPATVAAHWLAAGDADAAFEHLKRAAEDAERALAFVRAASLYGRAAQLVAERGKDADELRTREAECLWQAGEVVRAAEVWLELSSGASHERALLLRRRAGEALLHAGRARAAYTLSRDVVRAHGLRWPDTTGAALVHLMRSHLSALLRPRPPRPSEESRARADVLFAACTGLIRMDPLRAAALQAQLYEIARGSSDRSLRALAVMTEVPLASFPGAWAKGRIARLLPEIDEAARRAGDSRTLLRARVLRAFAHVYVGEVAQAADALDDTVEQLERAGLGGSWEATASTSLRLFARFYLGRFEALRTLALESAALAAARGDRLGVAIASLRHSIYAWLVRDDLAEAERRIARESDAWRHEPYVLPHHHEALARAHVALYRGEALDAYRVVRADVTRAAHAGVLLSQFVRVDALAFLGRAAVASLGARDDSAALRAVASATCAALYAERSPLGLALRRLIEAARTVADRPGAAPAALRDAARACERRGLLMHARAARWQAARLEGGPRAVRERGELERWAERSGVVNPARVYAALVPVPSHRNANG